MRHVENQDSDCRPGYLSALYCHSLAEFGAPLELPRAGGWLLTRKLPAEARLDAIGCYPIFCCQRWSQLATDLANLPADLVAVSLVCDPLNAPEAAVLAESFPDVCYHYKDHYVADLRVPLKQLVSAHHQRNARKAGQLVAVEQVGSPQDILSDWRLLYEELIKRHQIRGIAAFSAASFARLMAVPGLAAFAARSQGQIVGIVLFIVHGNQAYYHLAAYSPLGYQLKASFALFWQAFEALASRGVEQVSLGGGAGVFTADEGLSRFKSGWSSSVQPAYFCGRIVDREKYQDLVARTGQQNARYFPAYRAAQTAAAA